MQCFSPLSLPRPNGRGNRDRITVPCGKCAPCMNRIRNQWTFRLEQELKNSSTAWFITLTHAEENNNGNVQKETIQLFLKRLRKYSKFRYYIISEYGPETNRPHYHGLIFNFNASHDRFNELLWKTWGKGFISVGQVSTASINYCTGYMFTKKTQPPGLEQNFCLMSRNPGIGASYLMEQADYHLKDNPKFYAVKPGGVKTPLPRYYVNKFYNEAERQQNNVYNQVLIEKKNSEVLDKIKNEPDFEAWFENEKKCYQTKFEIRNTKNKKL
jgi:hypothetical protein